MASNEDIKREAADLLVDERARSARADLERRLAPGVPDFALLRARTGSRRFVSGGAPVDAVATGARSRRPLLLVAAVVALVAGVGASFALADSSPESVEVTSADGGPDSTATPFDDPNDVWGRVWNLEITMKRPPWVGVPAETVIEGDAREDPYLDLREEGLVRFVGCNEMTTPGHVDGDRLVIGDWTMASALDCPGPLDVDMKDLLRDAPTIELRGNQLTLTLSDGNGAIFGERDPAGN